MKLLETIRIRKGDVISIVGAGGKTTLMFTLAEELKSRGRVLVTTTTKIYTPAKSQYNHLIIKENIHDNVESNEDLIHDSLGIYVYGSAINEEGKLIGIEDKDLIRETLTYDYTLIEADGSKKKPVKGWNNHEPVISEITTITIGILSGEVLNLLVNENNVHRLKEFKNLTFTKEGELINQENILSLIFSKDGLFKNSQGNRILFINKVDNDKKFSNIQSLINGIIEENKEYKLLDEIIVGSLLNKEYKRWELGRNHVGKWNYYGLWT
ncbi:selenium cofactor biosynthesis protein YqeC [Clostridium sp.]|uniref:selenium cofactor biosynthesis protein YqeC n=1 Tax=Clostridium sp. TaxID=1506 RepID=UPI003217871C